MTTRPAVCVKNEGGCAWLCMAVLYTDQYGLFTAQPRWDQCNLIPNGHKGSKGCVLLFNNGTPLPFNKSNININGLIQLLTRCFLDNPKTICSKAPQNCICFISAD